MSNAPAYDVRDAKLPGNSLVEAIFNRRLMSWSDRGGASMLLGDCWAEHCRQHLDTRIGTQTPIPESEHFQLRRVLRLDDNPEVEREANLNQLENPDFLLIGTGLGDETVVQAADAKFAADRIKASQVSVGAVEDLLRIPESGATRNLLRQAIAGFSEGDVIVVPGVFLSPDSPFTDALLDRARRGPRHAEPGELLVRLPVDPGSLFDAAEPALLMPTMARIDRLPVSPRENLLAAVYYLRTSCACFHLWDEQTRPYFDLTDTPTPAEPGMVAAEVARRATQASSAYGLLVAWHRDLRDIISARKAVSDAISLPVGMDEIRATVGDSESRKATAAVRRLRGTLDGVYRSKLLAATGPIHSDDPRPVKKIIRDIRSASRELRPELLDELATLS